MITLVKGAYIYAPEPLGSQDIIIFNDRIEKISREIDASAYENLGLDIRIIDGRRKLIAPGLIDPHVHLIGGGGEGGYHTRTPETNIKDFIAAGITTAVGLIGTDKTSRHLESLYAKAKALDTEGMTAYMYTGNYHVPVPTVTGDIQKDIYLLDKVIGTAEVAISDHRSGQPSVHELAKVAADTRIGGLTSGKAGVTHFHVGPGAGKLSLLHELLDQYDIPAEKIYPTHVNRTSELIEDAAHLSRRGAYVDMTADEDIVSHVSLFQQAGGNMSKLTLSSDGNGSLPVFDAAGRLTHLAVARPKALLENLRQLLKSAKFSPEEIFSLVTKHPSDVLKLDKKGNLKAGYDADLLLFDSEYQLDMVMAKGRILLEAGSVTAKSTFDE
ncbi:beta-aspartyl-peptidase [Salinicoccus hispanicus]|uniref:Isoaspartyl dipeptidase n=1 Tax=Salinicoccus hispanicus TaxID=157225 RepID=A0A6N8U249_9STAP|nr:beta-aspartyl-peptidase [Salinicoccus hispanicus]MXQ51417.1 beta-aspartyl-peptidase [Salinicoccus hispanicus]